MYWTDWGHDRPMIARAFLDGTNREVVISTEITWPNGLALDLDEERLYWGDAAKHTIESADYLGGARKVIVTKNVQHVFGFSILGKVYVVYIGFKLSRK